MVQLLVSSSPPRILNPTISWSVQSASSFSVFDEFFLLCKYLVQPSSLEMVINALRLHWCLIDSLCTAVLPFWQVSGIVKVLHPEKSLWTWGFFQLFVIYFLLTGRSTTGIQYSYTHVGLPLILTISSLLAYLPLLELCAFLLLCHRKSNSSSSLPSGNGRLLTIMTHEVFRSVT